MHENWVWAGYATPDYVEEWLYKGFMLVYIRVAEVR